MRVASVRAARRKLVKLFKKLKSKFYWYDFTVRGRRYRASTQETKSVRALKTASLMLASVIENTDPLPSKPTALGEFAERFLAWVDTASRCGRTSSSFLPAWRYPPKPESAPHTHREQWGRLGADTTRLEDTTRRLYR